MDQQKACISGQFSVASTGFPKFALIFHAQYEQERLQFAQALFKVRLGAGFHLNVQASLELALRSNSYYRVFFGNQNLGHLFPPQH
ncbi:MAG: hypothetical protein U0931_39705 [Vulcanimicrobiota bacterium]